MINSTLARRYAKALVQIASENNSVDQFRTELSSFNKLFISSPEITSFFSNPAVTIEQKKDVMLAIAKKGEASQLITNFLLLIVDKNRVASLPEIAASFEQLADECSGVIRPTIKTAFELDANQIAAVQAALEKSTGKKVVVNSVVDKTLIGGVVTQIGDTAFDSSVRTQLNRIKDILQKG